MIKNISIAVLFLSVFCSCHEASIEENQSVEIDINRVINNEFWGIVPNSIAHAESNTAHFTAALLWCHENGYHAVKISRDTYYVNGENPGTPSALRPTGIIIPSNTELDLNGATFIHKPNLSPGYVVFAVYGVRNVKLYNGILVGDKDTHPDRDDEWSTHEWGFGIDIRGASDVVIDNLEIRGMTGDAVIVGGDDMYIENGGRISERVTVSNSRLHDCRRQGVSVIGGNEIWIRDNGIY
ncbi:MAG: right-handed parallel beta-helix repeat-containing protein, partial [Tannerella sp.]|nr:right-handed parallel beta-helix repeat-containing protein [Tannerella sp.]